MIDDQSDLERALAAFDAEAFAERHGGFKESRSPRSHEYLLTCVCGSDRLRWRHEPGVKQAWVCWNTACGRSGTTLDLVMLLEDLDRAGAIETVMGGYVGGDAPTRLREGARLRPAVRTGLVRLPQMAWPEGVDLLEGSSVHRRGWSYLHGRGIDLREAQAWRIGFGRRGRLQDYVIFPCFMDGGLVYYQGRACWDPPPHLTGDARKAWTKATHYRKTLNPVSREGQATAEEILFNYDRARVETHVVVVEGPVDAIKVGPHAVALLGKADSDSKVERLLRMQAQRYTIYLDPGIEEREKAEQLAAQLSDFAPTFIATPPAGKDPGGLTREENAAVIAAAFPFKPRGLVSNLKVR